MQFLIFHLGKERYGLHTQHIVRILPLLELKGIPHTPPYVAGLMNYHGDPVPVIDLCALGSGAPCNAHFDTRIILVDYCAGNGSRHLLGLIAERVVGIEKMDRKSFSETGVSNAGAPYLGQVSAHDGSLLQLIEIEHLLPEPVRAILFQHPDRMMPC